MNLKIFSLLFLFCFSEYITAEKIYKSEKESYLIETLVGGLEYPWAIEFITNKKIL